MSARATCMYNNDRWGGVMMYKILYVTQQTAAMHADSAPQVTVKSLAETGKASLLNKNITKVAPAPLSIQREASGQQYVAGGWVFNKKGRDREVARGPIHHP